MKTDYFRDGWRLLCHISSAMNKRSVSADNRIPLSHRAIELLDFFLSILLDSFWPIRPNYSQKWLTRFLSANLKYYRCASCSCLIDMFLLTSMSISTTIEYCWTLVLKQEKKELYSRIALTWSHSDIPISKYNMEFHTAIVIIRLVQKIFWWVEKKCRPVSKTTSQKNIFGAKNP